MRFKPSGLWKYFFIIITFIIPFVIWGIIVILSDNPPVEKIEKCRESISKARKIEAEIYSPDEFNKAEKIWNSALLEWQIQNEKPIALRKFDKLSKDIDEANELAELSYKNSKKNRSKLQHELSSSINELKEISNQTQLLCNKLPLNHKIRERLTPAILKLSEAEAAFNRENLTLSKKKIEEVRPIINNLQKITTEILNEYFNDFETWKKLNEEMISISKKNRSVSLVIDKFSRKCYVYKSGKLVRDFDVELGKNWIGDKQFRGDLATPEGKYNITKKKNSSETKYYKALLINFPNSDDKERFKDAKKQGKIPANAQIGGLIEIHGDGGKGIDWTEGCIALKNSDMDKLFSLCTIGTPIAIIGSLKTLDEIFAQLKDY